MLQEIRSWFARPFEILTTRESVIIVQMYPKDRVMSVSYKKQVKTAQLSGNAMKNMLKSELEFQEHSLTVFQTAASLLLKIINPK